MHKRVLIVDPTVYSRSMLAEYLHDQGTFNIVGVDSAADGMSLIQRESKRHKPFHILFLDVRLPKGLAWKLVELVRESTPEIELVLTGSRLSDEEMKMGVKEGVRRFLSKPYVKRDVQALIEGWNGEEGGEMNA